MKKLLGLAIILTLFSCSGGEEQENVSMNDPNDDSKKNGDYIWWINLDGEGEWIKKADDGTWEPTDGELTDYHKNGEVLLIANYLGGKRDGMSIHFDDEGDTIMKIYFHQSKADTLFQYFHKNGTVFIEAVKTDSSEKFNNFRINYPNGNLYSIAFINFDPSNEATLDSTYFYHENGKMKYMAYQDSLFIYSQNEELLASTDAAQTIYGLQQLPEHIKNILYDLDNPNRYFPEFGCVSGDCENGFGEYVSPQCIIYKGEFKNGFFEGEGELYSLEGNLIYKSGFHLGLPHGNGSYEDYNLSYTGGLNYGFFQGEGKLTYKDNNVAVSGTFERDLLQGKGYIHQEGFDSIVCNFKDDLEHGTTMLYYETGEVIEQKFSNGVLISEKEIK